MKRIILTLIGLVFVTGCVNINNLTLDQVIDNSIKNSVSIDNQYRTGYKYYLPRGLNVVNKSDYNEQFNTDKYSYYLYVDIVSYYNKVKEEYTVNSKAYYSKKLSNNNKYGYVEINPINDKYLVEIMYNYAKIEVIVKSRDLNNTVANCLTLLNSIKYNNNIIENTMGNNVLRNKETEINIFKTKKTESNYIDYEEMYGQYEEKETHDSDLIDKEGAESGTN